MSLLERPMTYEDLCQIPPDGNRYETIDGELLVSPAPRRRHQALASRLHLLVGPHVEERGLGKVYFAPVDVRITPHDTVQPDLLFIRQDRLHIYRPEGDVVGAPDLVVEILSPSTRGVDLVRKAALYARAGVPEYWLADSERPRFRLLVLEDGSYEDVEPDGGVFRSIVLPDLVIDVAALFAGLE